MPDAGTQQQENTEDVEVETSIFALPHLSSSPAQHNHDEVENVLDGEGPAAVPTSVANINLGTIHKDGTSHVAEQSSTFGEEIHNLSQRVEALHIKVDTVLSALAQLSAHLDPNLVSGTTSSSDHHIDHVSPSSQLIPKSVDSGVTRRLNNHFDPLAQKHFTAASPLDDQDIIIGNYSHSDPQQQAQMEEARVTANSSTSEKRTEEEVGRLEDTAPVKRTTAVSIPLLIIDQMNGAETLKNDALRSSNGPGAFSAIAGIAMDAEAPQNITQEPPIDLRLVSARRSNTPTGPGNEV